MDQEDIRWHQRLDNYEKALCQLNNAVELANERGLTDLEEQGLIQAFEFTHELAWNLLKDYFAYQGNTSITGSRDAVREAFNKGIIKDGEEWMEMIKSRNKASHAYNEAIAADIAYNVINQYTGLFNDLKITMDEIRRNHS